MRLFKRKNIYYVEFGRGDHRSLKTKNEALALKLFKEMEREFLRGRLIRLERGQLKLLQDFIDEYLEVRKSMAPNTYRMDRLTLHKFKEFYGNLTMAGITSQKLSEFKSYLKQQGKDVKDKSGKIIGRTGLKDTSCNAHIRHFKIALKTAKSWKYLKKDLDLKTDLKQYKVDKRVPVYMTKDDVTKLLSIANEDSIMRTAVAIQVFTGAGRAEIVAPIIIDETHIAYRRVKTKIYNRMPIAEDLKPYISHLKPGIHRVVPWKNERTYARHFEELVEKAEQLHGISPHKVRHTFASLLLQAGTDLKTVSELMGHASITVTAEFYAHITDKQKKEAVNRLKF